MLNSSQYANRASERSTIKITTGRSTVPAAALKQKSYDDATVALVKGMNFMLIYAKMMGMSAVADRIDSLKDDIALWASEQDFERSPGDHVSCPDTSTFLLVLFDMLASYLHTTNDGAARAL